MRSDDVGDVVLYNCDDKVLVDPFQDYKNLPSDIISFLKKQLDGNGTDLLGDKLSKIFLNSLVQLIGNYRDACKYNDAKSVCFDEATFVNSQPEKFKSFTK